MSNRLFQSIILQMKDTIERVIGVVDYTGTIVACSENSRIGTINTALPLDLSEKTSHFIRDGFTFCPIYSATGTEYAAFVFGMDEYSSKMCELLSISLCNIKQYYNERHDKSSFIKNVILDNILPSDIFVKAKELGLNPDSDRVTMLIRIISADDPSAYEVIQGLFPDKQHDFVFSISESDIVLVKEIKSDIESQDLEKLSRSIIDRLGSEFYTKVVVGIGTVVRNIKELARSFKEAQAAIEVGKVFDNEHSIISYENLGIARIIYQLPTTLCEMYLKEVFKHGSIESLDQETLFTIQNFFENNLNVSETIIYQLPTTLCEMYLKEVFKHGSIESLDQETLFTIQNFFENNLNVSETSRKLFVHRNTLVYRLEKIKKLTGLDLREFDHAIVFKVALMIKKYLTSNPIKY